MAATDALTAASTLRVPRATHPAQPKALLDDLLHFTLESAFHQGELSAERLELYVELEPLECQWDDVPCTDTRAKTDKAVEAAKRTTAPRLWGQIRAARFMIARLSEEIERLERDAVKVSRAYSILSGS